MLNLSLTGVLQSETEFSVFGDFETFSWDKDENFILLGSEGFGQIYL